VIGAANPFKEGDKTIGVAADNDASRENAVSFWPIPKSRISPPTPA
jgi:hypothetical protein